LSGSWAAALPRAALDARGPGCDTARVPARHATELQTISVDVPPDAVPAFEAALRTVCGTVGMFMDEAAGLWCVEGVKQAGIDEPQLTAALALAALTTGVSPVISRTEVAADGWLARTAAAFPAQSIGRRFVLRGTHLPPLITPGRITLRIDAGVAFGSGEHGSTRGCLRALERAAARRPRRILDLGTGSGVLALAAARLLHCPVLASDIDPWAVRTTQANIRLNHLSDRVRCVRANGWDSPAIAAAAPFDLVFANILARPLCEMAAALAAHLAPGGTAILAGLLVRQCQMVLTAHRRCGLLLEAKLREGEWQTLILRRPARHSETSCYMN
jgi:ribosomal protein L11 methyltransferase